MLKLSLLSTNRLQGQPFLVNRCAQILTEELGIPKNETITMAALFESTHTTPT